MRSRRNRQARLMLAFVIAGLFAQISVAAARDAKMLRVGAASFRPLGVANVSVAFLARMAELGYVQGRNFAFEFVHVPNPSAYGDSYRELVARKVDILVAGGPEIALKSALSATSDLPIVMIAIAYDPLALGYVPSLARQGGNVTGLFFQQIALTRKRLQLMQQAFPAVKAATVFWDRNSTDQWKAMQTVSEARGYPVHGVELRKRPYDFDRAFAHVPPEYRGGLIVLGSPIFSLPAYSRLADFALRNRTAAMFVHSRFVEAGGLISYGVNFTTLWQRAADYVDRIAKGTKPADLPIEQPSKFELVVNLKTAKALGLTIPPSILLRADKVIE